MSAAVFKAMLLALVRDRGALMMSFIVPAVFFLIFASVFSGSSGQRLELQVAVCDEVRSADTQQLLQVLAEDGALTVSKEDLTADEVRDRVRSGRADVGLIVRADGEPLGSMGGFGKSPIVIVSDPVRGVAVPMMVGLVQKAYFAALPDVALGSVVGLLEDEFLELSPEQQQELSDGLGALRDQADAGETSTVSGTAEMIEREDVVGRSAGMNQIAYTAGAVAVLFLLFSCVNGAITLLEERDSGVVERVISGPGSTDVLVGGKFLFIVLQGFVQVSVIFVLAWLVHGVDLPGHLPLWAITTLSACIAGAGLALAVVSASKTRRQAQAVSNIAVLVLSALGGSMMPRFFMPPFLRQLGWITPNTWALEAYASIFWRGEGIAALWLPWFVLCAAGLFGLWIARTLARRFETI